VRIVYRSSYMGPDDWHATVTRRSDGKELVWISAWHWLLRWKLRRSALDRAFRRSDAYERKASRVRTYAR